MSAAINRATYGHAMRLPADVRSFTKAPFWPITIKSAFQPEPGVAFILTNSDINATILDQLGIVPTVNNIEMTVKLKEIHVYCWPEVIASDPFATNPVVNMQVYSPRGTTADTTTGSGQTFYPSIFNADDTGNLTNPAKIGYKYSKAEADFPIPIVGQNNLTALAAFSGRGSNIEVYTKLYVSFRKNAFVPD